MALGRYAEWLAVPGELPDVGVPAELRPERLSQLAVLGDHLRQEQLSLPGKSLVI